MLGGGEEERERRGEGEKGERESRVPDTVKFRRIK